MTMTMPNRIRFAELRVFQTNGEPLHFLRSGHGLGVDAEFFPDKLPLRDRLGIMIALAASSWSFVLILFKLITSAVAP